MSLTPELSDESALVAQARRDPSAFGVLYQRYVDRIYAYIYHRVGNEQDTEDLTARTFYRALDKFDTYQDRGLPFGAWLFRIAHNLVANWHRDHSRRSFMSLDQALVALERGRRPRTDCRKERRKRRAVGCHRPFAQGSARTALLQI